MKTKALKSQKGITLMALVFTIMVLMIVAGVTISMLTSDHGIFDEAENAQMQGEVAQLKETTNMYVKNQELQKVKAKDHSDTTVEGELLGHDIVTQVETKEGLRLGVYKEFTQLGFDSEFGKGGNNIQDGWTGNMADLDDCFVIEFNTNNLYYIDDGRIWKANGLTTASDVKKDSEEHDPGSTTKPTTKPSTEPSTNPSTNPTTEPSTGPTTPTEDGTRVDISFAYYDASSKSQKIEGKEVVIKKGESNGTITPPEVSEIQIEVNGETVTAKPRGWSRSTYAKAEVEIQPGNTLTVTEADNRKTYYMSYEYVETVQYTKPDKTTGTVENKTYVDSNGNTVTEEGKIPTEDSKPSQDLQDEGWNNGKGDGEDQESGGSGVDKDKDIWTTDPDNPDDKSKWVDPTDPDTKVEGQVYPVYTKEITVNRKIYKNQEHDEGPITALMYRSIEEASIKPATVELGTANNATITQDSNGNDLDTEIEAEPRFWTTNEAANVEDTTSSNSDATKDEVAVALNGKAHLTKNTTYYMLYKYTSTVTYGIPKAEGEGEDTEEKQREVYVNANGNMDKQEAQTPDQPTAPSTWQPSPESWQWNGWNKEETPSEKTVNPDDIVEKEVTLHGGFKRDITVNFDADGGDVESVPEAITKQAYKNAIEEVPAKITIPEKKPTKGDTEFLHWTDKAETEAKTYEPKQEYEFTEDKTLYAVWKKEKIELTEPTFKLEPNEWTKTEVTVTITYPEGEGITKEYSYTGQDDWQPYESELTVEENKTVYARATADGKSVTSSIEVNNIDTDDPTIDNFEEVETTENSIEIKITASDKTSEVAGYQYYIDEELEADFSEADSHTFRRLTGGQEYTIKVVVTDKAGNMAEQEKPIKTKGKTVVDAGKIPEEDVGKTVTYETDAGVNEWLPFYQETIGGKNVMYMVAADYVEYNTTYMSTGTTKLTKGSNNWSVYWSGVPSANATSQSTNWWKKYTFSNTSNDNSKCAGSLLNATLWTSYKGAHGYEAVGSPSLEMYVEAYNSRYGSGKLGYSNGSYGLNYSGTPGTSDKAFCITDTSRCSYWWLASPHGTNASHLSLVYCSGIFSITGYSNDYVGLRPVVRLNPGVKLVKDGSGNYQLDFSEENK